MPRASIAHARSRTRTQDVRGPPPRPQTSAAIPAREAFVLGGVPGIHAMPCRRSGQFLARSQVFSCELIALALVLRAHPLFSAWERVDLFVNKLSSEKTQLPLDYYSLPFCLPEGDVVTLRQQNLGQFLVGDRVRASPYRIKMKEDAYCEQLCAMNLGRERLELGLSNDMAAAIREGYHHDWIVDDMPLASRVEDDSTITTKYGGGFPLGFVDEDHRAYIHNHVNIVLHYQNAATWSGERKFRIVRFLVQPFSIKHDFDTAEKDGLASIKKPLQSCTDRVHTNYEMIVAPDREPQPASGTVLFTYDVSWIENDQIEWNDRLDIYSSNGILATVHWYSIANSLVVAIMLLALIMAVLIRNLGPKARRPPRLLDEEEQAERILDFAWKLVHADVFRPPRSSPLLLSVCCGTGAQLLCTAFWTMLSAAIGHLGSLRGQCSRSRTLISAQLVAYALNGPVGGYVAARFYETFKGESWQTAAICTAIGFPGLAFGFWLVVILLANFQGSTLAVPMATIFLVLCLWLFLSTSLTFVGAYLGHKGRAIEFPVSTSNNHRRIPHEEKRIYRGLLSVAASGLVVSGACYVEYYIIHASIWNDTYYNSFAFLLAAFLLVLVTTGTSAVLLNYVQLNGENYEWWWRSFFTGGSFGVFIFIHSMMHSRKMIPTFSLSACVVYFGFIGLASLALSLMMGVLGTWACLWFNKTMFASIMSGTPPPVCSHSRSLIQGQENGHRVNSRIKKAKVVFAFVVLFSPAFYYPTHSGKDDNIRYQRRPPRPVNHDQSFALNRYEDYVHREKMLALKKTHKTFSPHQFGLVTSIMTYFAEHQEIVQDNALPAFIWVAIIALSITFKRRSALPGGNIYLHNQRRVQQILSKRRRRLRAMLEDPILLNDMEVRYGKLTNLIKTVKGRPFDKWWQGERKDEFVRIKGKIFVPWLIDMTIGLILFLPITYLCFGDSAPLSAVMTLVMYFVHFIDNMMLYKAASVKGASRDTKNDGIFVAVGVPIIEIA